MSIDKISKRYTLVNRYIEGAHCMSAQVVHGLNNLWKKYGTDSQHTEQAQNDIFMDWANHHEIEVVLNGGGSDDMGLALAYLSNAGLPYAFFMEPDANNLLTVVTFVADQVALDVMAKMNENASNNTPRGSITDELYDNLTNVHNSCYVELMDHVRQLRPTR